MLFGVERGWLSEERRDVWFVCVDVRWRGRQTDKRVAECGSESWGRCSHRNTVCVVVMVQSNTAHFFSPGGTRIFGDILGLCLRASALGVHMHILHMSVAAGECVSVHEDRKYLGKWHSAVKRNIDWSEKAAGEEPWALSRSQGEGAAGQWQGTCEWSQVEMGGGVSLLPKTRLFPPGNRTVPWKKPLSFCRPGRILGHVIGAEHPVIQREMNGEIDVDRGAFVPVVPMVKAWCHQEPLHGFQVPADIGMHEGRVEINDQNIGLYRRGIEAKGQHRHGGESAQGGDFQKMHPGAGKPVHAFCRMVHGMKPPQERDLVKRAMQPILGEVGNDHDDNDLHRKGQGRDVDPDVIQIDAAGDKIGGRRRQERQDLYHQRGDHVIEHVLLPFWPEDGLLTMFWKKAFQRNEQKPDKQDVEDKEIQTKIEAGGIGGLGFGFRSAQQGGHHDQREPDCTQSFILAEQNADQREGIP